MEAYNRTRPDSAETLITIAEQCPDSSCLAVHWARDLLAYYSKTHYFHPCESDSLSEEELWYYNTDSLVSSVLTLYPNPADEICIAEVDASVEGERIIYLYDTYGHLLEVYPILEEESSTELEVEELAQGVYLVLLYVDGGFRESKLLVVNHP
jgi:hypothetical protein